MRHFAMVLVLLSACRGERRHAAPLRADASADAHRPVAIAQRPQRATHHDRADPLEREQEASLARADATVMARIERLDLPLAPDGTVAPQPFPRIVIRTDGIDVDSVALVQSYRAHGRQHAYDTLGPDAGPVDARSVVSSLDASGARLESITALLNRVRTFDDVVRNTTPATTVNIFADVSVPAERVARVVRAAAAAGFVQATLAGRREGRPAGWTLNASALAALESAPIVPVVVVVHDVGVSIRVANRDLATDCRAASTTRATIPDGGPLSHCLLALRHESQWSQRLATQFRIGVRADPGVPYRRLFEIVGAVVETQPNLRDLFSNPGLDDAR